MRSSALQAGSIAAALFALYAWSAPSTVALEDDAFFILASYFLGVAHPPGYPLFTALGKLATLVPVGTVAYRVHLLSAAFGAASCAALWYCARALTQSRLAAALAALALGLSPAFWSQSIIAEVYTLNTLFVFVLLYLALSNGSLALMAFLFGLSLANHWPLMLLVAPAYALLLWPRRQELLTRCGDLVLILLAGLVVPYAWMVWRSWQSPIAFTGPIDYLHELWFTISRQGYAQADTSPTATWFDRIQFFAFQGRELLLQFALAGTLLAAVGFWAQWRRWGLRVAGALTLAFAMPSFVLLLLLGFDYDALHKHLYHVYPLPAYGIAALWAALGLHWLAERYAWRAWIRATAATTLLLAIFATGSLWNLRSGYDWTARYAAAVLRSLPPDASLVLFGDAELGPVSYYHLIENWRPDVTLYQAQGLLLGNRLMHPMRSPGEEAMRAEWRALIERENAPVAFMQGVPEGYAQRHYGLYVLVDKNARNVGTLTVELPDEVRRFVKESLLGRNERDPWSRLAQSSMRERIGGLLAMSLDPARAGDEDAARTLSALAVDYAGALGIAEGLLANKAGYSARQVGGYLDKARELMPADAAKDRRARFFELRAYLRLGQGDTRRALEDLETAVATWPAASNRARIALADLRMRNKP